MISLSRKGVILLKKRYLITYDLNKPGQNYSELIEAIKAAGDGGYVRICQSAFLICSSLQTAHEVFRALTRGLDRNDDVFISEVTSNREYYLPDKEQLTQEVENLFRGY